MNLRFALIFALSALTLPGSLSAASVGRELNGDIALVIKPSNLVAIRAAIYSETEGQILRGYALRMPFNKSSGYGHIDLAIHSSSGDAVVATRVALMPTPLPRGVLGKSTFLWELPGKLDGTARVELSYHTGPHLASP